MDKSYFLEAIECPAAAQEKLAAFDELLRETETAALARRALALYDQGDSVFFGAVKDLADHINWPTQSVTLGLYVHLVLTKTWAAYQILNIPESIFRDTMTDISLLSCLCHDEDGFWGIQNEVYRAWFRKNIDLNLFRLGRLQFEPAVYHGPPHRLCRPGQRVVNVHIPRGIPLDETSCEAAYAQARSFFPKYLSYDGVVFVCHSWLLDPLWGKVLKPSSRIVAFQNKYELLSHEDNTREAAKWIFHTYEENPAHYPQHTSLQRAAVAQLLSGRELQTGLGLRV